jgi:MraZ protein
MGSHQGKLDAKGRVSIPALFRTVLRAGASEGPVSLILRPSHTLPCIEGWAEPTFEALGDPLQKIPLFSADHEDLSAALYADAYPVESDKEGRIVLPDLLARHAGLSDAVVFMGQGKYFGIWEPQAADARRVDARARSFTRGITLPGVTA